MALPLNQISGMPKMSSTLSGWQSIIDLYVVTQTIVDGFPVPSRVLHKFRGTIQPLSPEAIKLKSEGQRSWEWLQIHVVAGDLNLSNNDVIEYNGVEFKVMAKRDYTLNGYVEYHAVKDYT